MGDLADRYDRLAQEMLFLLHEVQAERDRWREECWQILLATGADPDGDDPRHLSPGEALRAVRELRDEIRDADKDLISIHRRFNIYAGALREIAAATPSYADGWPVPDLAELVGVAATALKRGAGLHDERKADRG